MKLQNKHKNTGFWHYNRLLKTISLSVSSVAILLFFGIQNAQADSVHQPNPCSGVCTDVQAQAHSTTTANIHLGLIDITVTIEESLLGASTTSPIPGIPPDKIFVRVDDEKFICSQSTDINGRCTINDVPSGFDGNYTFRVDNFLQNPKFDNLPFQIEDLRFDSDPSSRDIKVTLFELSVCDQVAPKARCSGDFLQNPEQCIEDDPDFPNGFFQFSSPGLDCGLLKARVCPGEIAIARGTCQINEDSGNAECVEGSCDEFQLCTLTTPFNDNHPDGFFETGDVVEIIGSNFTNDGGEVRIGNTRIFIDPNDPRPEFTWTDNLIRFILPAEARTGLIGIRPLGYGFKVGLDSFGETIFLVDEEGFLIPVFCLGGIIKIQEFDDLEIISETPEINVSVSGN